MTPAYSNASPPQDSLARRKVILLSADRAFISATAASLHDAGYLYRITADLPSLVAEISATAPCLAVIEGCIGPWRAANVCRELRKHTTCPLIAIDHSADVIDRIIALEMGADDYLSHPVHQKELITRMKVRLRGNRPPETDPDRAHWRLDISKRLLEGPNRQGVVLSQSEQQMLADLLAMARRPRQEDGPNASQAIPAGANSTRTAIARLRQKLAVVGLPEDAIRTIPSAGYILAPEVATTGAVIIAAY